MTTTIFRYRLWKIRQKRRKPKSDLYNISKCVRLSSDTDYHDSCYPTENENLRVRKCNYPQTGF